MSSHLKSHGIKFNDYVYNNLDLYKDYKICPICKLNVTRGTTCSRECYSTYRSLNYSGENSIFYGKKHSQKSKDKISKSKIGKCGVNTWSRMTPETRLKTKSKLSKIRKKRVGKLAPMYGKKHSIETIKKIVKGRSSTDIEVLFSNMLDRLGVEYYHQFFIVDNGNVYAYDFKLVGYNILIECDGDYWHGNPNTTNHCLYVNEVKAKDKLKTKIANGMGYELYRFWGSQIKNDIDDILLFIKEKIK